MSVPVPCGSLENAKSQLFGDQKKTIERAHELIEQIKRMNFEDIQNSNEENIKIHITEITKLINTLKSSQFPAAKSD